MKTALEIALEKLGTVESDPKILERQKYEEEGKRLFGKARTGAYEEVAEAMRSYSKETLQYIRAGYISVYVQSITLPQSEEKLSEIDIMQHCAELLLEDAAQLRGPFTQLESIARKYLSVMEQIENMLSERYKPLMKEREVQMSQKLGYSVKLDPKSIPEIARERNSIIKQYREKFSEELEGFKQQLRTLFEQNSSGIA